MKKKTKIAQSSGKSTKFELTTPNKKNRKASDVLEPKTKAKSAQLKDRSVEKLVIKSSSSKPSSKPWKLSDFKAADYNPRYISDGRLRKLKKSMETFGDLSGVVFNRKTKRLVSGHQRLKTIGDAKTTIETKPYTDKHGTIEVGHVIAHTPNGSIKIPLRVVDWSEDKVEKAANIAANSHGGEFDKEKLRKVLTSLETHTFDIELLGLDPLSIQSLTIPQIEATGKEKDLGGRPRGGDDGEFQEYTPDSFQLSHTCPRCSYKFDDKGKEVKSKPVAKTEGVKTKSTEKAGKVTPKAKVVKSSKPAKKIGLTKKKK